MAQTLKFGNKTWATKVGSTLAYNDENGNYKPLPFNFTRSTSATRVNKEGLIEVVTNDRPRIDYTDTSDGVLLLENAATNLIPYSEDFSQWIASDLTVTDNNAISPDGTLNASKLTAVSGNATKRIQETGFTTTSTDRCYSIFVKTDDIKAIQLLHSGDLQGFARFDLVDYTVGSVGGKTTAIIEDYGNGWYKCTAIFNSTNAFGSSLYVYFSDSAIGSYGGTSSQVGDLFIYGAQYEEGSYPSSYIPTQGSVVTRAAETASGAGNSEVFNDSEGVLFADIAANANDGTNRYIGLTDGTTSNRINILIDDANKLIGFVSGSSGIESNVDVTNFSKCAFKYKSGSNNFWVNGFKVGSTTDAISLSGLSDISFNTAYPANTASPFYGKTKEISYYDTILTDLELETLTSYKSWTSMVNELNLNIIYNG